ncbi:MAG: sulfotransferase family protein [Phycisphaerales bacterium]
MLGSDQNPRHFFIVGSPRSGTTLLQAMLLRTPGLHIPPETHFMGVYWARRSHWGDLADDENRARLCRSVLDRSRREGIDLDHELFRRRLDEARSYAGAFRAWLDATAAARGASIVGEKSPPHTEFTTELLAMFPDARVLHIVRDPRDVAVSQRDAWGRTPLQAALRWRLDAKAQRRAERLTAGERHLTVRYRDLVTDPEGSLRRFASFLEITFRQEMLHPEHRRERGFHTREAHKAGTLQPVTRSRIGRYRDRLSRSSVALVEHVAGREMRRLGFDRSTGPLDAPLAVAAATVQTPRILAAHLFRR